MLDHFIFKYGVIILFWLLNFNFQNYGFIYTLIILNCSFIHATPPLLIRGRDEITNEMS